MDQQEDNRRMRFICLALLLGTFIAYSGTLQNGFINHYDDDDYVVKNPWVLHGLSFSNLIWAFTAVWSFNWHPLTWISHMLDCQIFGLRASGHHLTNMLLHSASTLLLFGLMRRMTARVWASALVAALFAWHPLHVQSVAWVAERKDVLSAFFMLLAMHSYCSYAKEPGRRWYGITLLFFAMGLMAKPMLVTVPFLLLLMDYWPLGRLTQAAGEGESTSEPASARAMAVQFARLAREKIPFFLLAAGSCVITFLAQRTQGAVVSIGTWGVPERLNNSTVSYLRYLLKMFWPAKLSAFYPVVRPLSTAMFVIAIVVIVAVTALALLNWKRRPYLLFGWFWYLGTLVPVIGFVQVGAQAMADRYTYIPLIGIFIMAAFALADLASARVSLLPVINVAVSVILAACVVVTMTEVKHWKNSLTLFEHAASVTPPNVPVEGGLAESLRDAGRYDEAMDHLNKALKIMPGYYDTYYKMGLVQTLLGKTNEAIRCYDEVFKLNPDHADSHYNLGNLFAAQGKWQEAAEQYELSVKAEPNTPDARSNLGVALLKLGRAPEAVEEFKAALRISPDNPEVQDQLADAYYRLGFIGKAETHYREALRLKPDLLHARLQLGLALARQAQFQGAANQLEYVVQSEPTNFLALFNLAAVYEAQGRAEIAATTFERAAHQDPNDMPTQVRWAGALALQKKYDLAIARYRSVLEKQPDSVPAIKGLAKLLAACPADGVRNGNEAVQLAEHGCEITKRRDAEMLGVLDQAYAEAGRMGDAIKTAEEVRDMATNAGQTAFAEDAKTRLESYKQGKAWRR